MNIHRSSLHLRSQTYLLHPNMKNKLFFASFIVLASLLTSCNTTNMLVLDVEKPASLILPRSVKNVTFVYNDIQQPDTMGHYDYTLPALSNNSIKVSSDSVDIIFMETLANSLIENDGIDNIKIYEYPTRKDNNYFSKDTLKADEIVEIAQNTDADAVISIDRLYLESKKSYLSSLLLEGLIVKALDLKANVILQIHSNTGNHISPPVLLTDSIFWSEMDNNGIILADLIPAREEALKMGAAHIAQKVRESFAPYWISEPRYYYGDNKKAVKELQQNNFLKAREFWIDDFEKESNPKKQARLANNIALTYELTDSLIDALKWIQVSCELFEENQNNYIDKNYLLSSQIYREQIGQRLNDFRLLDMNKE